MARVKKSFTDINPALQFISAPKPDTDNTQNAVNTQYASNTHNTVNTDNTYERKTKRLNLLLQPSLMEDISKLAHMRRTSVNDLICIVMREHCEMNTDVLDEWTRVFGKSK